MIWLLLLLPLLVLLPDLGNFIFQPGSPYSDLVISHFPNAFFLQTTLTEWGQIPLWSPQILSGYPFAANPLAGLYYPPGWLAVGLPAPFGFHLTALLHILWGGAGMALWLRSERISRPGALTGALIFEGMAKIWAHLAAGHITLVYAVCWTPWLLWAESRRVSSGARWGQKVLPGVVLGLIFLADPRWSAYSGLLWLGYMLYRRVGLLGLGEDGGWKARFAGLAEWVRRGLVDGLGTVVLAALLAAPLLLPLVEYTRLSTRATLSAVDSQVLSLPPERLLNLFLPDPGGPAEWTLYPGAAALMFGVMALSATRLRRRTGFWLIAAGLSILFALGSAIPINSWLTELPGLDLLRVPPRAIFLAGIALAGVAACGVDGLASPNPAEYGIGRLRPLLWVSGLMEVSWLFVFGLWVTTGRPNPDFLIGAAALTLATVLALLRVRGKISAAVLTAVILAIAILEPLILNRMAFEPRSPITVFDEASQAAAYLKVQAGQFRVFSPSYSIPQQTAARYGLELADGVDPLQLRAYSEFMERASGIAPNGYSVTLPAFASGEPGTDNRLALPDPRLLGWLNVGYVVSEFEINRIGLELRARFGNTRIYANERVQPRAWIELDGRSSDDPGVVEVLTWQPNRIEVGVRGPGRMVLSEIMYPGWEATVDGIPTPIEPYAGLLRSVQIGPGYHQVVFDFQPASVRIGLWIGLSTAFVLVVTLFLARRKLT